MPVSNAHEQCVGSHLLTAGTRHITPFSLTSRTSKSSVGLHHVPKVYHLTPRPGNFSLLPLRTRTRGPAQHLPPLPADVTELTIEASHESYDILDETIALFRANTFFRNFEIKGPADRVLIYGILFVSEALSKIKAGTSRRDSEKVSANVSFYLSRCFHRSPRALASNTIEHD